MRIFFMFEVYKNVHAFRHNGKEGSIEIVHISAEEERFLPGESQKPSGSRCLGRNDVKFDSVGEHQVSVRNHKCTRLFNWLAFKHYMYKGFCKLQYVGEQSVEVLGPPEHPRQVLGIS